MEGGAEMEMLDIKNLSFKYPDADKMAICGLDLTVSEGEMVLLCGASGSGKTTLLRLIKNEIAPHGELQGEIRIKGQSVTEMSAYDSATSSGYVMQNPDNQIVTELVRSELAFALENLGKDKAFIKRRIGEICTVFGLTGAIEAHTYELSGGQKQILNLASVMTYSPALLLLDEPSAYLDPVAAEHFFETVRRLNRENGVTVIVSEHKCGELFGCADKIAVLEDGKLTAFGEPEEVVRNCQSQAVTDAFPAYARLWKSMGCVGKCPISVPKGRELVSKFAPSIAPVKPKTPKNFKDSPIALKCEGIRFRYKKSSPDILKDVSITLKEGEITCLLGGNGSGKSTLLKVLAGIKKPLDGKVKLFGKKLESYGAALHRNGITALMQNARAAFITEKVMDDLLLIANELAPTPEIAVENVNELTRKLKIEHLTEKNPLDLSGGEIQLCAVAKALLTSPKVLLLDEPEKGMDGLARRRFVQILKEVSQQGVAIMLITHDLEFAANVADTCALMFDGEVVSRQNIDEFFLTGEVYTTETVRLTRGIACGAVKITDVCGEEEL